MSLSRSEPRSEPESPIAERGTGADASGEEPAEPAPLPAVPGLVMLVTAEDAPVCSDGTCL
ncbi:hypothetical protein ACN27G_14450 [Plantactinospora sp. WMMB334]|uniref:hypothetical protein n=1 Tax=Plantactinospora sp. WMMB334 TaxID=3404119 RepID=UPI003B95C253